MTLCTCRFPAGLSLEEVREYEKTMQEKTNSKVKSNQNNSGEVASPDLHSTEIPPRIEGEIVQLHVRAVQAKAKTTGGDCKCRSK